MIEKLKSLQLKRGTEFKDLDKFEQWADEVEPLLSLSPKHEGEFSNARLRAVTCQRMSNDLDALNNMDEAIGILNKAVTFLEIPKIKEESVSVELEYPTKITWPWLKKHVEMKHWIYIVSLGFAIFISGIAFGNTKFYQEYIKDPVTKNDTVKNV
ncbi:MAG: hypothetical protein ACI88H_001202 [Cocleimonas sp.]